MKVFFKTLALLLVTNLVMAQGIEIGAKGSLYFSNISKFKLAETVLGDSKILTAGGGGIFAEIPIGEGFSVRPEVGFARRGSKITNLNIGNLVNVDGFWGALLNNSVEPRIRLDYIDVPVVLKYKFAPSDYGNAYVFGGPNFGFLVEHKILAEVLGAEIDVPVDFGFKTFEMGAKVGAGYEFPFTGKVKGFIEANYLRGFSNIVEDYGILRFKSKNNNFGISAGVSIPLGI